MIPEATRVATGREPWRRTGLGSSIHCVKMTLGVDGLALGGEQAVPDGDESSEWEKVCAKNPRHDEDLRKYQSAYAFTDIDKALVVVKDTQAAAALYRYLLRTTPTH